MRKRQIHQPDDNISIHCTETLKTLRGWLLYKDVLPVKYTNISNEAVKIAR